MPGGDKSAWEVVKPVLETVSAKVNNEPCVTYIGESSSGHYVKMVHNGIEYGLMQLIAEAYDVLKRVGGLSNKAIGDLFDEWNKGRLSSFLMEISADIMKQPDDKTDGDLIDAILDKAKQKGTGKWTSQTSMDLGVPVPTIDSAVAMRGISSFKPYRGQLAKTFPQTHLDEVKISGEGIAKAVEEALYFSFIVCYAQGMHLLAEASEELNYNLDLEGIARIWRGGCIIRAELLEQIRKAYSADSSLKNMMGSAQFSEGLASTRDAAAEVLRLSMERGVSTMCLSSALQYFDAFRTARLPLNMVQGQRDYFGSHTYERIDAEGTFHTEWKK